MKNFKDTHIPSALNMGDLTGVLTGGSLYKRVISDDKRSER